MSTYNPVLCGSTKCEVVGGDSCIGYNLPPGPGCTNNTCGIGAYNPFMNVLVFEGFVKGTLYARNGWKAVSEFIFTCMGNDYLEGLVKNFDSYRSASVGGNFLEFDLVSSQLRSSGTE
ncbi:hypothetical protein BUALT_Bualt19G0052000 [Buddleja alternifolia]|uniref:Uncharacterized protein n=1 Tax=Buddleja alternifolia TaxID=168488 RepID=A0AAV6W234_9LAMI|nr:hypothetical protein BUALT_Bualt19G0052000 [Buddleja alternifolia]